MQLKKRKLTSLDRLWSKAADELAKLGVWRVDPTLRDVCKLWASTRTPTPRVLAQRYLYELVEALKA